MDHTSESHQHLGAVEAYVNGLTSQVNASDIARMVSLQQHMLSRFEKTNEMLLNFNTLSENRFIATQLEFKKHISLLVHTKKDLDSIFKRIRTLKEKLRSRYPDAVAACTQVHHVPDDDDFDGEQVITEVPDEEDSTTAVGVTSAAASGASSTAIDAQQLQTAKCVLTVSADIHQDSE